MKTFAVTDFEGSKWINYLCNGYYDGKDYLQFTAMDDYLEYLHQPSENIIFAHFGGIYDFLFILKFLLDSDEFTISDIIPRGSSILCFKVTSYHTRNTISFYDSSALLSFSLRSLAINFEVETKKGEIDYDSLTKVTPELLDYMKDDHLALYQILNKFFEWDMIALHGWKFTLASQALHIFKKQFYKKGKTLTSLKKEYDTFIRKSYQGGRTEIFNMVYNDDKKPLYCYDVNSLYPSVMLGHDYPSSKVKFHTKKFYPDQLGFYHCKVFAPKMEIPILGTKYQLPNNNTTTFIFAVGELEGYWSIAELNYAIEHGYKILEIYEGLILENDGKIFDQYVNYFYNKRLTSKNETDKIICKLFLNSLYGRFGMSDEKEKLGLEKNVAGERFHSSITTDSGVTYNLVSTPSESYSFSNVAVASYVTSYARIRMHKHIMKIKCKVWYMDTDSLFTPVKIKESKELGEMKLEYSMNKACFMLPKTYLVETDKGKKIAMKGFDKKKIQHFTFDDFMTALEGDLKTLNKSSKNPLTIKTEQKMMKFKTALNSGQLLNLTKPSIKRVCSKYDKRILLENFKTEAITLPLSKDRTCQKN